MSTTKHSASMMILGGMALNGEKMLPVWFAASYRLTMTNYKDILATKVLPWVIKTTKRLDCVFQRGGAPVHTAKALLEWFVVGCQT